VSARGFLILGLVVLVVAWAASGTGLLARASAFLRLLVGVLFVLAAVRIGLSIAILAFDLSLPSFLIPIALGVLAWWLRPGGKSDGSSGR
jgi:hypothetical protein